MPTFTTLAPAFSVTPPFVFPSGHPAYPTIPPVQIDGRGPIYVNAGSGVILR